MNERALALASWLALAMLALPCGAIAQDDDEGIDPTQSGYYVALSAGTALDQFSGGDFDNGYGGGVLAGYRAGQYASVELEAQFLENFETRRGGNNEVDLWLATVNFRLHVPMGRFEPYLTYGVGALGAESTGAPAARMKRTDLAFKGGAGLAFFLSDDVSIFGAATYAVPLGSAKKFEHATFVVGAQYKWEE